MGHSATNRTTRGTLKAATSDLQNDMSSSAVAALPGFNSTNAAGTSTYFASGIPTTWASFTAGWRLSSASISAAATFSPADLQHVLVAAMEHDGAVLVERADVSRMEPAVAIDGLRRSFRILVVALEHAVAAHQHFAVLADGRVTAANPAARCALRALAAACPVE